MIHTGVSGWMCDFGESVPLDVKGEDPANYHSLYPTKWGQLNSDAIRTSISKGYITEEQVNCQEEEET